MVSVRSRVAAVAQYLIVTTVLAVTLFIGAAEEAVAQHGCETISFRAGTEWSLCWELRQREGLVIHAAAYKDKGGVSRQVLHRGSIAEVHVPYHTGTPRYLDVSVDTAGLGGEALNLTQSSVPGANVDCTGVLRDPKVCMEIHDRGYAWKYTSFLQRGQEVTYWISSQMGQYIYITRWTFRDDGSFVPEMGFTGRLQIFGHRSAYAPFGSRLNDEAEATPRFGINHMHNAYWRLDLDIAGFSDDAVNRITQLRYTGPSPDGVDCNTRDRLIGTCHINQHTPLTTEIVERLEAFKTWHQFDRGTFNLDGRRIGYEIIPKGNQLWTGPSTEPWAAGELYITAFNNCERFAVNNNNPAINPGCESAAPHVLAMVNAQAIRGADVVLWYTGHFQHVVRDEDELNMPIEYIGLELQPRSWRHINTLE